MSKLPPGWVNARVGTLVEFAPKNECDDVTQVGFVPLQLLGTTFRAAHRFEQKTWGEVKKGYTHFSNGDVLLARITPSFENGKAGIACNLPNGVGAGSTEYFVCRPKPGVLVAEYLLAFFKTQPFVEGGTQVMSGVVGQQRVPKQYVLDREIPLPPFDEQKRIVRKLDVLFKRIDACHERLDRVPQILKRFRESVLSGAVSGKLTEEWRAARGTTLSDWVNTVFADACSHITVGHVGKMVNEYRESGIPFLRSMNVRPFYFDRRDLKFISRQFHQSLSKSSLRPGDVVVVRTGVPGQTCVIPQELREANCSDLVIVRTSSKLSPHFAEIFINAEVSQSFVRSEQVGVAQAHFNVGSMKRAPIALPSLEEQSEIVERVSRCLRVADAIEERYTESRAQLEQLTSALLEKAFRGELLPPTVSTRVAVETPESSQREAEFS